MDAVHTLTRLGADEAEELFQATTRSAELLLPWVTPPTSVEQVRASLCQGPDARIAYGVRTPAGELAAAVNLTAIIRSPFQSCFQSCYAIMPHQARGYVRAGLVDVLGRAFTDHTLHRVEANVQPGNGRSVRLIQGLGLRFEGRSPRYLNIGGAWRDHDHYAITAEEWLIPPHWTRAREW